VEHLLSRPQLYSAIIPSSLRHEKNPPVLIKIVKDYSRELVFEVECKGETIFHVGETLNCGSHLMGDWTIDEVFEVYNGYAYLICHNYQQHEVAIIRIWEGNIV
jgi:hypothetical protein